MKRIDSVNARPNANGAGKTGFHDNADLSGQDATYLTPDWLNHLQEELCNLLEKNSIALNAVQRDQLYQLLATNDDIIALATAVQQSINNEAQIRANNDNALSGRVTTLENAPAQDISGKYDKTGGTISGDVTADGHVNANNGLSVRAFGDALTRLLISANLSIARQYDFNAGDGIDNYYFNKPIMAVQEYGGNDYLIGKSSVLGTTLLDKTAERFAGVTYTNSLHRPIFVIMSGTAHTGSNSYVDLDGERLYFSDNTGLISFPVSRDGGTYSFGGSFSVDKILELS